MDFETFDESIGTDGYYNLIRRVLFPNSRETSFTIAYFNAVERNYPKGSYFSRVRGLSHERANAFLNDKVDITEFYPPGPMSLISLKADLIKLTMQQCILLTIHTLQCKNVI